MGGTSSLGAAGRTAEGAAAAGESPGMATWAGGVSGNDTPAGGVSAGGDASVSGATGPGLEGTAAAALPSGLTDIPTRAVVPELLAGNGGRGAAGSALLKRFGVAAAAADKRDVDAAVDPEGRGVRTGLSRTGGGATGGALPTGRPGGGAEAVAGGDEGRVTAETADSLRDLSFRRLSSKRATASFSATLSRSMSSSGIGGCMARSCPSNAFWARS